MIGLSKYLMDNNLQFNQHRLFHSLKFIGKNFDKSKDVFTVNGDLVGERNLINDYLIEKNEIHFTHHLIFVCVCILTLVFSLVSAFTSLGFLYQIIPLSTSLFFYLLARHKKEKLVMNDMSISFSKSVYDYKIMGSKQ
jgi:hypothetical protein